MEIFFIAFTLGFVAAGVFNLNRKLLTIMTTAQDLIASIAAIGAQLTKAKDEITAKIADLEAAINGQDLQAVADALNALKTSAQSLDDVVPDAPAPAPAPAAEAPSDPAI